jgi:hypothetical protein
MRSEKLVTLKKPHEIQIHMALTVVGDPFALSKEAALDKEVNQWAVRIPAKKFGSLRRAELEQYYVEFFATILKEMRNLGAMRPGE